MFTQSSGIAGGWQCQSVTLSLSQLLWSTQKYLNNQWSFHGRFEFWDLWSFSDFESFVIFVLQFCCVYWLVFKSLLFLVHYFFFASAILRLISSCVPVLFARPFLLVFTYMKICMLLVCLISLPVLLWQSLVACVSWLHSHLFQICLLSWVCIYCLFPFGLCLHSAFLIVCFFSWKILVVKYQVLFCFVFSECSTIKLLLSLFFFCQHNTASP